MDTLHKEMAPVPSRTEQDSASFHPMLLSMACNLKLTTVDMAPRVYTHVQSHQVVHSEYVQFLPINYTSIKLLFKNSVFRAVLGMKWFLRSGWKRMEWE